MQNYDSRLKELSMLSQHTQKLDWIRKPFLPKHLAVLGVLLIVDSLPKGNLWHNTYERSSQVNLSKSSEVTQQKEKLVQHTNIQTHINKS